MFELDSKIEGVKSYYLTNGYLLVVKKPSENHMQFKYYHADSLEEVWFSHIEFRSFFVMFETKDVYLGFYPRECLFNLNKEDGSVQVSEKKFVPETQIGEALYGRYTDDSGDKFISSLNPQTLEIKNLFNGFYKIVGSSKNNILYVKPGQGHYIYCYNIGSETILWERDIETKLNGKIVSFLDQFAFYTTDNYFICLDNSTGETIWKLEGVGYLKSYRDKLYGLDAIKYTEVAPETGKIIKQFNLESQYETLETQSSAASYTVGEEYIYFNDVLRAKIGVLEKSTGKIIWTFKLPVKKNVMIPASNVPQLDNDKMCLLDSDDTLHIFESSTMSDI